VAVIVNDMSEVNIDAALVRDGGAALPHRRKAGRDDQWLHLLHPARRPAAEVRRWPKEGRFDYLLIESTGIAEPLPVAATFDFATRTATACPMSPGSTPWSPWSMPPTCSRTTARRIFCATAAKVAGDADDRALVDLLVEQIEFADVIVLNKVSDLRRQAIADRPEKSSTRSIPTRADRNRFRQGAAGQRTGHRPFRLREGRNSIRCGSRN
jgi:G3E family GTPase